MLDEGHYGVGLAVLRPIEIAGQWEELDATAATMNADAQTVYAQMDSSLASWQGLRDSYRDSATQEVVWSAMDQPPQVTTEWAQVITQAADVLRGFAAQARGMQHQARALEAQADGLEAQLAFSGLFSGDGGDSDADASAEDDALRRRIAVHNSDVQTLNGRWQQLDEQTAAELTALDSGGGPQEDIPEIYPAGGMVGAAGAMGVGIGAGFSSGGFGVGSSVWPFGPGSPLEKLLGALGSSSVEDRMEEILDEINGDQYEGDWGSWAEDNQEVAAELASNELSQDSPVPNGAEDLEVARIGVGWS